MAEMIQLPHVRTGRYLRFSLYATGTAVMVAAISMFLLGMVFGEVDFQVIFFVAFFLMVGGAFLALGQSLYLKALRTHATLARLREDSTNRTEETG
jgi:hypothetical protein